MPAPGNLVTGHQAARTERNPATGESIKIAAKTTVKFRIGEAAGNAIVRPKKCILCTVGV